VVENIIIQAVNPDQLREIQLEVEGIMRARRQLRPAEDANFSLETADQAISFWNTITNVILIALLPMLVSIALVVGAHRDHEHHARVRRWSARARSGCANRIGARRRDILHAGPGRVRPPSRGPGRGLVGIGSWAWGIAGAGGRRVTHPGRRWRSRWSIGAGRSLLGVTVGLDRRRLPRVPRRSKLDPVDALRYMSEGDP
jgi:hypothetical protein